MQPTGRKTYFISYRLANGKRNRVKLGGADILTPAMARANAKSVLAEVANGRDPKAAKRKRETLSLGAFIKGPYAEWTRANARSAADILRRLESCFGPAWDGGRLWELALDQVSAWDVERWRNARVKARERRDAGAREITYLKAALSKAVTWGLLKSNPLAGMRVEQPDSASRVWFLDIGEGEQLPGRLKPEERVLAEGVNG